MAVEEAHVIVRIRRRKSPGPAARFAGVEDADVVGSFEAGEGGLDSGVHEELWFEYYRSLLGVCYAGLETNFSPYVCARGVR